MEIKKKYIGKHDAPNGLIQYYMLENNNLYGVEVVEGENSSLTSRIEWLSEDQSQAIHFITMLQRCGASSIHLGELIDDYLNEI